MLSIVIPTYNERTNIEPLVTRIAASLQAAAEPFEVIVVDDNSPDGTADEVRRLQPCHPWLRLVQRTNDRDLSRAVLEGWKQAQGDVLGCMDADLQHPPELLSSMATRLREQSADMVIASRYVRGGGVGRWNILRRLTSRVATSFAALILDTQLGSVSDPMSGFFLVRRSAANLPDLAPRGQKILVEVLVRGKCKKIEEEPFKFATRERGGSKAGLGITWQFLCQVAELSVATGEIFGALRFFLVGATGVAVNFVGYWLLRRYGWPVPIAAAGGCAAAILNNFTWNETYTFAGVRRASGGIRATSERMMLFLAVTLAGLLLNVAVVSVLSFREPWPVALTVAIAGASIWNFFAKSSATWREKNLGRMPAGAAHRAEASSPLD